MTELEREIEIEAVACRAAFEDVEVGDLVHCCHHNQHYEMLMEPARNRINWILKEKPLEERALRLRLFRPVKNAPEPAAWQIAEADWKKAYDAWKKAETNWNKEEATLRKAEDDWNKAYDAYFTEHAEEFARLHSEQFPNCTWNGSSIFGKSNRD